MEQVHDFFVCEFYGFGIESWCSYGGAVEVVVYAYEAAVFGEFWAVFEVFRDGVVELLYFPTSVVVIFHSVGFYVRAGYFYFYFGSVSVGV